MEGVKLLFLFLFLFFWGVKMDVEMKNLILIFFGFIFSDFY